MFKKISNFVFVVGLLLVSWVAGTFLNIKNERAGLLDHLSTKVAQADEPQQDQGGGTGGGGGGGSTASCTGSCC
ncbi:MAG TPA: hypothetical protein VJB70_04435 [Candidatus Paceibacterota bacterium]